MPWTGLSVQVGVQQLRLGAPLPSHGPLRTEGWSARTGGQKAPAAFSLAGGGWGGTSPGNAGSVGRLQRQGRELQSTRGPREYGQDGSPGCLPLARGPAELGPSYALCLRWSLDGS